ncbi:DUF1007 family protein [Fulvimarina sp. MAC3]|uniref:DUF1007 family protein n=1 Tax=Fulvimarina sp. MAC3 TaxID=3148887 RepID=UPI0031FBD350
MDGCGVKWARSVAGALLMACAAFAPATASAHPHVFVTTSVQFVGDGKGDLTAIRTGWVFDELFSASLLMDFDENADGRLDESELKTIAGTVLGSARDYDFFTFLKQGRASLALSPPDLFHAVMQNGHLVIMTEMRPKHHVALTDGPLTLSIYDPSYYVSFDVTSDRQIRLTDVPGSCHTMLNADEPKSDGATDWLNQIAGLGKSETIPADGINYAELLSTKVQLTCS